MNTQTCLRFKIRSYPTILYISNGKYYKYKGSRTIEDFKNFVSEGYKNAEDQGPIPQPPGWFEQFMDTLKEAMIEVYEALDPILN